MVALPQFGGKDVRIDLTPRRGMMVRRFSAALVATTMALTLTGCPWDAAKTAAKDASYVVEHHPKIDPLLPAITRSVHWIGDVAPEGGTLKQVAKGFATALETGSDIRTHLQKIAASDDPYGKAFAAATCKGLTQIASEAQQDPNIQLPPPQAWYDYLLSEVAAQIAANTPLSTVQAKVSQFNTAAQLATINPRLTYAYARACTGQSG
jgi:hypothetical protein